MSEEWGPWIEHDQSGIPVPIGTIVHRVFDEPVKAGDAVGNVEYIDAVREDERGSWSGNPYAVQVIRYRIRKPRGMEVLEALLANLPEKVNA